jgi:hypothetical protein
MEGLDLENTSLLSKWLFKLFNEGVWQKLLHNKYILHSKTLSQVTTKPTDSLFWKGLMNAEQDFLQLGSAEVCNGLRTRFLEDTWHGDKPLSDKYPSVYNIMHHKTVAGAHVLGSATLNIGFRRTLNENKWDK